MSDDVKMAIVCLGLPALFVLFVTIYLAFQDWLVVDAAKKAFEAQKEICNMPEKCKDCPYCRLKEEKWNEKN